MTRLSGLALAFVIAAAPAVAAQDPGAPGHERVSRSFGAPSIAALLQDGTDLGLTSDQVARIEAIQQQLREQNAPLLEQLRAHDAFKRGEGAAAMTPQRREALRSQMRERNARLTPEQRAEMRQRMESLSPEQRAEMRQRREAAEAAGPMLRGLPEELRPVARQLQANTRDALARVRDVLSEEQQLRLRDTARQRSETWRDRGGMRRGARGGR